MVAERLQREPRAGTRSPDSHCEGPRHSDACADFLIANVCKGKARHLDLPLSAFAMSHLGDIMIIAIACNEKALNLSSCIASLALSPAFRDRVCNYHR